MKAETRKRHYRHIQRSMSSFLSLFDTLHPESTIVELSHGQVSGFQQQLQQVPRVGPSADNVWCILLQHEA